MKLDHPLLGLIKNCETLCEADCCGRNAFDFSPIHMASFLLRYGGEIKASQIAEIQSQLQTLEAESVTLRNEGGTTVIHEMNQVFTGQELAELIAEIAKGLALVPEVVFLVEHKMSEPPTS
jgi:hypothetical protein